jgi:hypothetical protein
MLNLEREGVLGVRGLGSRGFGVAVEFRITGLGLGFRVFGLRVLGWCAMAGKGSVTQGFSFGFSFGLVCLRWHLMYRNLNPKP